VGENVADDLDYWLLPETTTSVTIPCGAIDEDPTKHQVVPDDYERLAAVS